MKTTFYFDLQYDFSLAEEKAGHCETVFPTLGAVVSLEKSYSEDIMMLLLTITWIYNLVHDVVLIDMTSVDTRKVVTVTIVALGVVVIFTYFNHNIKRKIPSLLTIMTKFGPTSKSWSRAEH